MVQGNQFLCTNMANFLRGTRDWNEELKGTCCHSAADIVCGAPNMTCSVVRPTWHAVQPLLYPFLSDSYCQNNEFINEPWNFIFIFFVFRQETRWDKWVWYLPITCLSSVNFSLKMLDPKTVKHQIFPALMEPLELQIMGKPPLLKKIKYQI